MQQMTMMPTHNAQNRAVTVTMLGLQGLMTAMTVTLTTTTAFPPIA